jgi:hypothetical protein
MRKALLLGVVVLLLIPAIPASAQFDRFKGSWINIDPDTGGITRLEISGTETNVQVHAWGKCHPTDCDWGQVAGYAYGPNVSANLANSAQSISAVFDSGFSQTLIIISPIDDQTLQAEVFTRFTDQSGRSNYSSAYVFVREQASIPTPLLYLPFDGDIADHSANSFTTTATGSITFVPGIKGQAAQFDGSGEAVEVTNSGNLSITDEMTLEFWVNMDDWKNPYTGSAHVESIASRSIFYTVHVNFDTWDLEARVKTEDTGESGVEFKGGQVPPGQWHHIALVYRGSENKALLFLDGTLMDEQSVSGPIVAPDYVAFTVGTWYQQNQAFAGLVDELRLYDVGLSNDQISALASGG